MADWEKLRDLTHDVVPPDFASVVDTARRRQRRARVAAGALASLVLIGAGIGIADVIGRDDSAPPQPSERPSPAELPDGVEALPQPAPGGDVDLDVGRYRVPLDDTLAFDVDVADKTTVHEGGLFVSTGRIVIKTEVAGEDYGVPRDACTHQNIRPVGPTVDDLVRALTDLPPYEVSQPEPVRLGGASGRYLEAQIPSTYDASQCDDGAVRLPGNTDTAIGAPPPYVGRWWVVDVDGQRVVIQQNCWGCTLDQLRGAPTDPQTITFASTP